MGGTGSGGHNRKSAKVHQMQGTYRHDRHGAEVPGAAATPARKSPPPWLPADGAVHWKKYRDVCAELGTLDSLSEDLFALLCLEWAHIQEMRLAIETEGHLVKGGRGDQAHPLHATLSRSLKEYFRLAKEFGLPVKTRPAVAAPPAEKQNPFAQLGS